MKPRIALLCLGLTFCTSVVFADVTQMTYRKTDIGGGTFQYDFTWTLTNDDGTYLPGQGFNWIIFGDASSSTSTLDDFVLLSETFPNPNLGFTFSSGGHNGPTFLDTVNISTDGWIPTGVGDSVMWSGTSLHNVPNGAILFSSLIPINGANAPNFQVALEVVPEPACGMIASLVLAAACCFRPRKR